MLDYRSRAAFKLIEIDQRYNILKPGQKVIDLGSTPGSWTQVICDKVKSQNQQKPNVLAIDILKMNDVQGAKFIQGNFIDENVRTQVLEYFNLEPVDVIVSDMAHNLHGDQDFDHMMISRLNQITMQFALVSLKIGGSLLMKTFQGALENDQFKSVKPTASRARSSEIYYLGRGFKLGDNYIKLQRVQEALDNGLRMTDVLTEQDIKDLNLTKEEMRQTLKNLISILVIENKEIDKKYLEKLKFTLDLQDFDVKKFIKEAQITKQNNEQKDMYDIIEEMKQQYPGKFTFTKKMPKDLDEFEKLIELRRKKFEKKLELSELKKKGILPSEDEQLLDDEEDDYNPNIVPMHGYDDEGNIIYDIDDVELSTDESDESEWSSEDLTDTDEENLDIEKKESEEQIKQKKEAQKLREEKKQKKEEEKKRSKNNVKKKKISQNKHI